MTKQELRTKHRENGASLLQEHLSASRIRALPGYLLEAVSKATQEPEEVARIVSEASSFKEASRLLHETKETFIVKARVSAEEMDLIQELASTAGVPVAEIVRAGLRTMTEPVARMKKASEAILRVI